MSAADIIKTLAPSVGGLIGLAGGPVGGAVGAGIGSLISGGIGLLEGNQAPGVDPSLINALNKQAYTTDRLLSGQGLSDATYTRGIQAGITNAQSQLGNAIAVQRELGGKISPLTVEGIANKMLSTQAQEAMNADKLTNLDINQTIQNLKAGIAASAEESRTASVINAAKIKEKMYQDALNQRTAAQFANAVRGITSGVTKLIGPEKGKQPVKSSELPKSSEPSATSSAVEPLTTNTAQANQPVKPTPDYDLLMSSKDGVDKLIDSWTKEANGNYDYNLLMNNKDGVDKLINSWDRELDPEQSPDVLITPEGKKPNAVKAKMDDDFIS